MTTELPIDREIEAQIEALDVQHLQDAEYVSAIIGALHAIVDRDSFVALFGMTRQMDAIGQKAEALRAERARINRQYDLELATLASRMRTLTGLCEDVVREHREAGAGNSINIPGLGTWGTRKVPKSWELNIDSKTAEDAVLQFVREHVGADEAVALVRRVEEIDRAALRAWLDTLDDETYVPVHEALGSYIAPRPERVSVSFSREAGR